MAMIRPETEMKDSGIEWIGDIPANWGKSKLKYLGVYINGYAFKPSDWSARGRQIIRIQDLTGSNSGEPNYFDGTLDEKYRVVNGDILVSWAATLDAFVWTKEDGWLNQHIFKAVPNEKIVKGYFLWLLKVAMDNMNNDDKHGIVMQHVTIGLFNNYVVPLAPYTEQQAIADYLDETCSKIDEIIAEAKASIVEYKELRESVISNATTRGIKKNRCMKPSGVEWLPEIPSDWNVLSPKVVFAQRKDRAIKGERQLTASQKHGIMYQDDYMKEEGVRIVTVEKDFSILKHVEPDDFVISMRSFQGGLEYSYLRGCISSAYVMLIPNHKYVYSEYYKWFFKSDKYINALQSTSDLIRDGQALRYANFVKLKLFDIPIEEQKEIADYLNKEVPKIDSLIAEKESLINDLEAYKKSLIYEVVTGKRRVV